MRTVFRQWLAIALAVTLGRAMLAADPSRLLKTFVDELVPITPGVGKFPAKTVVGTTTLAPTSAFRIAKYEVPQNLYQEIMGDNPSRWRGPRNSVEMMTLDDAKVFCEKLTARLRQEKLLEAMDEVRLPTEVEWEYCCRAGAVSAYCFGDDERTLDDFAWHTGNAAGNDPPVGAKKPNAWNLYDMHGYLWEWCAAAPDAKTGVLRGGAWTSKPADCRSDSRRAAPPDTRGPDIGFRCVVVKRTP